MGSQMVCGRFVSAAKALPVVIEGARRDVRMTIFGPAFNVRRTMVVEVLARAFDAVMETLTLNIPELARRSVPAAGPRVDCRRRTFLQGVGHGHGW